jgi:hypothetical protein
MGQMGISFENGFDLTCKKSQLCITKPLVPTLNYYKEWNLESQEVL